jgi:hypothetical protein
LGDTKADVLVIFDCCYAGDLGRTWRQNLLLRSSEFIGATVAGALTKIPGKSSFTTALIWALEKLANERPIFTTSELVKETCNAPDFPKTQVPILAERNAASNTRIQLSKLSPDGGELESPGNAGALGSDIVPLDPQYLSLRFAFDNKPSDKEIKHMALSLNKMIKTHALSARRVDWGGLRSSNVLKIAATKFREGAARRKARRASGASMKIPISPATSDDRSSGLLLPTVAQQPQFQGSEGGVGRWLEAPESDRLSPNRARKLEGGQSSFEAGRRKRRRATARSGDDLDAPGHVVVSDSQG